MKRQYIKYLLLCILLGLTKSSTLYSQETDLPIDTIRTDEYTRGRHPHPLYLGAGYATGTDQSHEMYGVKQLSITLGGRTGRITGMYYYFSYTHTPMRKTTDPEYAINGGVSALELGGEIRLYTPVEFPSFGHYFFTGAGASVAYWKFSGNQSLAYANSYSTIWGIDWHCGTGFYVGETIPFVGTIDVIPGIKFWFMNTYQGYFDTHMPMWYYVKVRISFSTMVGAW